MVRLGVYSLAAGNQGILAEFVEGDSNKGPGIGSLRWELIYSEFSDTLSNQALPLREQSNTRLTCCLTQ